MITLINATDSGRSTSVERVSSVWTAKCSFHLMQENSFCTGYNPISSVVPYGASKSTAPAASSNSVQSADTAASQATGAPLIKIYEHSMNTHQGGFDVYAANFYGNSTS